MKSLLLVVMGLLLIGSVASAAELISDNSSVGNAVQWPGARTTFSLTQNLGSPIALSTGVFTCGNVTLGYTTESWSLRRFSPYWDAGLDGPLCIDTIDWGVRRFVALLDSIPNPITVDVQLYSISAVDPLLWTNLSLISSTPVPITMADNPVTPLLGTWKSTPVATTFDPLSGDLDLVVAIHQPEGYSTTPATRFACSADNVGETAESYYKFDLCGFIDPATPSELGSPGVSQLVLIINGANCEVPTDGACCYPVGVCTITTQANCVGTWTAGITCTPNPCLPPVPVETKSWGQVKSLYR